MDAQNYKQSLQLPDTPGTNYKIGKACHSQVNVLQHWKTETTEAPQSAPKKAVAGQSRTEHQTGTIVSATGMETS